MDRKDDFEIIEDLNPVPNEIEKNSSLQPTVEVPIDNIEVPNINNFEQVNNVESVEIMDEVNAPIEMVEPVTPVPEVIDIDEGSKKPEIVEEQVMTEKQKEEKKNKSGLTLVIIVLLILILFVLFLPQISEMLS